MKSINAANISKGGLIVLDDASLNKGYDPSFYSTAGHPGPGITEFSRKYHKKYKPCGIRQYYFQFNVK